MKKTKQRESVLAVLREAGGPLSATDICARMEEKGETAWLSTVYRVLEMFVDKGIALKTDMVNSDVALYELNCFQHKHYAICMRCHKIIPMDNCPMEHFIPRLEEDNFRVVGHNLEVFGYCKDCAPRE